MSLNVSNIIAVSGQSYITIQFDQALNQNMLPSTIDFGASNNFSILTISSVVGGSLPNEAVINFTTPIVAGTMGLNYSIAGGDYTPFQTIGGSYNSQFYSSIPVSAPVIVLPSTPSAPLLVPASDSGLLDGITNHNVVTLTGTASPGDLVTIYETDGTTVLGTATADGSGAYSVTTTAMADGSHTLKATDTSGGISSDFSVGTAITIVSAHPPPFLTGCMRPS